MSELINRICEMGARLDVVGDNLRVTAPTGVLTEAVRAQLVGKKRHVLELVAGAPYLLNQRGLRLLSCSKPPVVALWRDADGPEVRAALACVGLADAEVRYLDDPDVLIPDHLRECVPDWIRQMWRQRGLTITPDLLVRAELKARRINAAFDTYGTSPQPSRVKAATVLHGMLARLMRENQPDRS